MSDKAPKKKVRAKPAAKKKAAKEDDKSEAPKDESAPVVQMGPSPQATVMARHEYSSQERRGKGFSFGELAAAGVSFVIARTLGVPVDLRRRSTLDGNVSALKGWYKPAPKKAKEPKPETAEKVDKPKKVKKAAKTAKKKEKTAKPKKE